MSSGPVLIVVPVLDRPHRVGPLLESIEAATPEPHRVLFACTAGMDAELAAVRDAGADYFAIPHQRGDYARKINHAISAESDEPLIFCAADDLHFHEGWLPAATAKLTEEVGVVGTNDLGNRRVMKGRHATHSLVTRDYAEQGLIDGRPGLLCEMYWHEYVDDELVATAKHRNAWSFAADSIVEHLHPDWGKAPMDDSYAQQKERMRVGFRTYQRRSRLWRSQ